MSTEPFVGEVKVLGFYFAPLGYMTCQGQLLSIAQNTALFSLLGNIYGGDGRVTFGLPDLQGRRPIGQGQGPGLSPYTMGEDAGVESTTLLSASLPMHIHSMYSVRVQLQASTANADVQSPQDAFPATTSAAMYTEAPETGTLTGKAIVSGTTDISGGNNPVSILNPYLCMNYSIAIEGIFPSRN